MRQDKQSGKSPIPLASLVALASMTIGVFLYQSALKSDRPGDVRIGKSAMVGQQVLARLWEDPFEAVARHEESETSEAKRRTHKHSLEALQRDIATHQQPITVIAVIVESDPYAEGKELRLRNRYAVLSALGEAGYAPADDGHIGYFNSDETTNVPFEWYESSSLKETKEDLSGRRVLILWLLDNWKYRIEGEPHCRVKSDEQGFLYDLAYLMCDLNVLGQGPVPNLSLRILGPSLSGMVRDWMQEVTALTQSSECADYVKRFLKGTAIYSYSATADPAILYPRDHLSIQDMEGETKRFEQIGIHFERTVSTDRELAEVLVEELQQRGVDISAKTADDHRDHIALIAEWDTLYGRTLPLTFKAAAQDRINGARFSDVVTRLKRRNKWQEDKALDLSDPSGWIHSYAYLRGLDGVTSGKAPVAPDTAEKNHDAKTPADDRKSHRFDTAYLERPEGQSQFDYIRRLTLSIERDQERLKREGKRFRAIGILGSDVYDKLLISRRYAKHFLTSFSLPRISTLA